ncbi:OmpG family monomeric porin [Providencia hangzhouensis]|uniref:OmpG family monomeric porin n=1 Tax=Providencia hangzhouensis TaxID=3031799 RepID=UPI0034DCDF84
MMIGLLTFGSLIFITVIISIDSSHEAETEFGVTYKYSDALKAKFTVYIDNQWDKHFSTRFLQSQVRAYLPITIKPNWKITPYALIC